MFSLVVGLVLLASGVAACRAEPDPVPGRAEIEASLAKHRRAILALPHVVGVGLGRCGEAFCIRVLATEANDELRMQLERLLGGTPYAIETGGPLTPLPDSPA